MRRSVAPALWAVVLATCGSAWAWSNDDNETSLGVSPSLKMTESAAAVRCVRSQP